MPIVPETRKIKTGTRKWTLGDSALLSAGFVWRERFNAEGTKQEQYRSLRDQVEAQGMRVLSTRLVTRRVQDYVHHTHHSVPVQPYHTTLDLGSLANPQAVVMLGQSRHLGSGLLKPIDVDLDSIELFGGTK